MGICAEIERTGKRIARRLRKFGTETTGAALVETTLLLPFLLMLSAGVFEFCNMFHQRLRIEAGVRDAARYRARCPMTAGFDCTDERAQKVAVFGDPYAPNGTTLRVDGWTADVSEYSTGVKITPKFTDNNLIAATGLYEYRGDSKITTIKVETRFTYTGTGLLQFIGFNNIVINAVHEERYIGW